MAVTTDYDVIVLGAGAPGEHCAGALAAGGLRVAVVERDLVGGECSYWACTPSKTLLRPGEAARAARMSACAAEVDVEAALAWRDSMVNDWSDAGQLEWLAAREIDLIRGTGRLAGRGRVEVEGSTLSARHVVVATGSSPFVPPIPGLADLEGVWSTREATSLAEIPRSLVVLGGGPAGVELAQAIHRLGADVTIVEPAAHLLSHEPAALGEALGAELMADGIHLALDAHVVLARREGPQSALVLDDGRAVRGDRLLVATGRRPRTEGIGLESIDVVVDEHGIRVDDRLSAADGLWAIGDVTGLFLLTYVGKYQADVAAANILGEPRVANYAAVPRVVFTDPQAAAVGAMSDRFSGTARLSELPRMATYTRDYADSRGFLTLLSDGEYLTGAIALGPEAGEWLQQATVAIRASVPLSVMSDVVAPFPSFSEILGEAMKDLRGAIQRGQNGSR